MKNLLVMKFGGTSVGSAARMRVSAGLAAAEQKQRPVAMVVSAAGSDEAAATGPGGHHRPNAMRLNFSSRNSPP